MRRQSGFTLIELMVTMAVVAVMVGLVVGGMQDILDSEMKDTATRLGSTIRYLYNKAVTERVYLRLVYDLNSEKPTYKVESATEPFVILSLEEEEKLKEEREKAEAGALEAGEGLPPEPAAGFSEEDSHILKPIKLKSGLYFKDIQVSYREAKFEEGIAYTYFFPNGYATPTIINLRDEDDEINYSLEILPLSGRVRIRSEYRELAHEKK